MGKVIAFKRAKRRTAPPRAMHLEPILAPIFANAFDGKTEEERREILASVGEDYGTLIRRYFGEEDAKHYVRVFCGGVRTGGGRP